MKPKKTTPVRIPNPDCERCDGTGRVYVPRIVHGTWYDFNAPCTCLRAIAELPPLRGKSPKEAA